MDRSIDEYKKIAISLENTRSMYKKGNQYAYKLGHLALF